VRETVAFTGCIPSARDSMTAIAWTSCAGDTFPADDTWRQSFTFDSIKVADVSVRPLVPETVMLTIPRELYARSCGVTLDIAKLTGQYAVLAGLKLYQCEPYRRGSGGGDFGGMQAGPCGSAASFCDAGPTVFGSVARISYVVTGLQPVTVAMYDAQGRIVRTLAAGEHAPGTYALQWDGTDAHGVRVPAGAYFCRLGAIGPVRKLVLTR
jgi:hypothetical protein